ncbi:MAG TPA: helix-turn-helix transcriptional regulator [Pirellulaceae bacterium]|nr:helix-turn-helix transcriptional regulator [Pirellulaceae bacterium]
MQESFERELLRGSLDLMVLSIIAEGPQYGYSIQKRVAHVSREQVSLAAGTLYPLLHRLEGDGLIKSRWDEETGRRRKWYEITAAGKRSLKQKAQHWQQYAECVWSLIGPFAANPKPLTG